MTLLSRAAGLAAAFVTRAAVGEHHAPDCDGHQEEFTGCMLEECDGCKPVDCAFGDWEEWYDGGGCSGLVFRERRIATPNNECGKPCEGAKTESKRYILKECEAGEPQDCAYEQWSDWTSCGDSVVQRYRYRSIDHEQNNNGAPCEGHLKETEPCAKKQARDCELDEWQDWTSCSATCGKGRHTRMRRVKVPADEGGQPCTNSTLESKPCFVTACDDVDCAVGDWAEWSVCGPHDMQRHRSRAIEHPASGSGSPCAVALEMTESCPSEHGDLQPPYSDWSSWSDCTRSCGNGAQTRSRKVHHVTDDSVGPTEEVRACGTDACPSDGKPCRLSDWGEWSSCAAVCGDGSRHRRRTIEELASGDGTGCVGAMSEMEKCSTDACEPVDCRWGDWMEWSACSNSCGGGSTFRHRHVIQSPQNGGKECEALDKEMIASCNTQACEAECQKGTWADWGEWSPCSTSCSAGYRSRSREEALLHEGKCTIPPSGDREQFELCTFNPDCQKNQDCALNEWEPWAACSRSCFGVSARVRTVKEEASGNGTKCGAALREVTACNPSSTESVSARCTSFEKADCELEDWSEWSSCSVTCGGGTQERFRRIAVYPTNGGKACPTELGSVLSCNTNSCAAKNCTDCEWGAWTEWSPCSSKCHGQQYRHRNVAVLPNSCGATCDAGSGREIRGCGDECPKSDVCDWSDWSDPICHTRCTESSAVVTRMLHLVSSGDGSHMSSRAACSGLQQKQVLCAAGGECEVSCEPRDCEFSSWSEWTQPGTEGLCERHRSMLQINNECGRPCNGPVISTKQCISSGTASSSSCYFSAWSEWTSCETKDSLVHQRYRRRQFTPPQSGGTSCEGPMEEVDTCDTIGNEQCEFSAWSSYSPCSVTCGVGSRTRTRSIAQENLPGEAPCEGPLSEIDICKAEACPNVPCLFSQWDSWSACSASGERTRTRKVERHAEGTGTACNGPLRELISCGHEPVDCEMSEWTHYGSCDKACGGGQQSRQRQIHRFAAYGGELCDGPNSWMMTTRGCNESPCSARDCKVDEWSEWGSCSSTCGRGYQSRARNVLQSRTSEGVGCDFPLEEYRSCEEKACATTDCKWGEWLDWGDCSSSCGGGQKLRSRHIAQSPSAGGAPCAAEVKEEVASCNTHVCGTCVPQDGLFGDWSDWSECSATCRGGETFRTRRVVQMANECGTPVEGPQRETRFCSQGIECAKDQDCEFGAWSDWEGCTSTCNGVRARSRRIKTYGAGNGAVCEGGRKEIVPCNVDCGHGAPEDCTFSDWSGWGECDRACGPGQHTRSRTVETIGKNGGALCDGPLEETRQCQLKPCSRDGPIDCLLGDWEQWGACSKCGGQRKRFRKVLKYPQFGGRNCEESDMEVMEPCDGSCREQLYCAWTLWGDWTACSRTCGQGQRGRRRKLQLTTNVSEPLHEIPAAFKSLPLMSAVETYEALGDRLQRAEAAHTQELTVAFACGGASIFAALAVGSVLSSFRSRGGEARMQHPFADASLDLEH